MECVMNCNDPKSIRSHVFVKISSFQFANEDENELFCNSRFSRWIQVNCERYKEIFIIAKFQQMKFSDEIQLKLKLDNFSSTFVWHLPTYPTHLQFRFAVPLTLTRFTANKTSLIMNKKHRESFSSEILHKRGELFNNANIYWGKKKSLCDDKEELKYKLLISKEMWNLRINPYVCSYIRTFKEKNLLCT